MQPSPKRSDPPSDIRRDFVRKTPLPADDGDEIGPETGTLRWLLVAALLVIAIGGTIDLILDRPATWRSFHVLFELGMIVVALGIAIAFWGAWWRAERSIRSLARSLKDREAERDRWRRDAGSALEEFARAIERQFASWSLTPTEREIAFLLLEGHGHKQIAARTGRSERTVRQHAVSIYAKSGLGGRAELAAFFLEGLLPRGDAAGGDPA
jgi:DNA-binding CsgD family transcriptional regulator